MSKRKVFRKNLRGKHYETNHRVHHYKPEWFIFEKKSQLTTFLDYALQLIRQNNRRNNPNPPNENENRQHRFKLADLFDENFFDNMKPEAKQRCVERLFEAMFVSFYLISKIIRARRIKLVVKSYESIFIAG